MALSQSVASELLEAFRAGEGVDLIRESVRLVMQELIETEAAEQIGAGRYERTESRTHRPQRVPAAADRRPRPGMWSCRSRSCGRVVLPGHPGAAAADRPGVVCGGDGGLRERRLDPGGRRPGRRAGHRLRHLQVGGVADLRRPGRAGRRVPHPAAAPHHVSVRVPRRHLPARPPQPGRSPRWPSSSRPASPPTAAGKSSASTSATPRTRCSGGRSCAP